MNKETTDFFRKEAQRRRDDSLFGAVRVHQPLGWPFTLLAIFLALMSALLLASIVRNPSVESVPGVIEASTGVATVKAPRAGTITTIFATNGEVVRPGQLVTRVATPSLGYSGRSNAQLEPTAAGEAQQLAREINNIQAVIASLNQVHGLELDSLRAEFGSADRRAAMQAELVRMSQQDLEHVRGVFERGFLSKRDFALRQEKLMEQRQGLATIEGERSSKLALMRKADADYAAQRTEIDSRLAQLLGQRSEILRTLVSGDFERGYTLAAPIGGRIENLSSLTGDSVSVDQPLYSITPVGSRYIAKLLFSERLASTVRVGDEVRLSLVAYPARRYGYLNGRITQIFGTPSTTQDGHSTQPVYVAFASVDAAKIAFPKGGRLLHGMRVEAHLATRASLGDKLLRFLGIRPANV